MSRVLLLASVSFLLDGTVLHGQDKPTTVLEGTWIPSSAVFNGSEAPANLLKDRLWVITGDQIAELNKNRREGRATLSLVEGKKPAAFDVTYTEGAAKGQMGRAIYKIEGDTLTICMALPGERPTEFASKRGDGLSVLVFKRAK